MPNELNRRNVLIGAAATAATAVLPLASIDAFGAVAEVLVGELEESAPQFQPGDLVRCKDPVGYERHGFEKGKLYTVLKVFPYTRGPTMLTFKELAGIRGSMFAHRFELATRRPTRHA